MSTSTKCKIQPVGWNEEVIAHVDDETWEARWHDPDTGLSWTFPHDSYTVVRVYEDEPEAAVEPHPCVCSISTLMNRGCVCGHLAKRYTVPR